MKALQDHFPKYYTKYKDLYGNEDKYGNLDSKKLEELGLIWPEIRGYKLGYELKIDYTSKRYVPEGRIETNLMIAEVLHRLAYLKSFFIKSSKYETRQLNLAANFLNTFSKDISLMSEEEREKLDLDKVITPYIDEYLQEKKSKSLRLLEKEAYMSVSKFLELKEIK
jgi:hypothetical protein